MLLCGKAANYVRLVGPVHFGNEAAAWSRDEWFTHMICVDEELSRPSNLRNDVIFRKIGITFDSNWNTYEFLADR